MLCYRMEEWYSFDMEMWIRGSSIQDVVFQQDIIRKNTSLKILIEYKRDSQKIISGTQIKQYNKEKGINIKII